LRQPAIKYVLDARKVKIFGLSGSGGAPTARASFIVTAQSVFDPTTVIKLSVATLNDANHEWMERFAALIKKNSDGRMKAEIWRAN
jgi:TRAP-type C4-dicarboxylate transport system substrate-binding protein